ncbi:ethanolamine ammonia-lyase reactivating factor EutA [Clostridium sp. PL3]|uniref:Ethanolamine ammonia-lyase reactivating factor EutA n=1 Tax=Clostridium thailandense TaxID=2794346 RepID=A0A949WTC7_9CLOT|nr:ethanolamine ammonia-lyase reactivating factor EutA [Clostridium thailandense]MBV7271327.1 ethanolamine ammonia-lyase reactivating factor EutA [Clostridium thailandense]
MSINEFKLISAGIDIGTTTTQLIISELILKNRLPGARMPKIEIVSKKVLYQSRIYITPIIDHRIVDAVAVKEIIKKEYEKAGFQLSEIDTGALIITGETAKKENAEKIVHELAEYAGDFVVAVAGPELESILAGKGAGAAELSKTKRNKIINLDIGGGTTNIAVFEDGNVVDSTCVNVGGRLIEIDKRSEIVTYISKPAQMFIDNYGLEIILEKKINKSELTSFCDRMVDFVDMVALGEELPYALKEILMVSKIKNGNNYDGVMFSGGVAEYIYKDKDMDSDFEFSDIGKFLAKSFKKSKLIQACKEIKPSETIRATVVGAGTQTVNVSGSTVFIDASMLPLRNIPVAKVVWEDIPDSLDEVIERIVQVIQRYKLPTKTSPLAVSIPCPKQCSFENIEKMAKGIYHAWDASSTAENLLVVIVEKDIGKVLGQTLYRVSNGKMRFMSIDSVNIGEGDYIDVGKPISTDDVVPIIIKTLVFSSK